jgi:histidinol-phosphate aminotransferase
MNQPRWRLRPLIDALPKTVPFVGPEAQERARGKPFLARIGANECLFGPSPKAIAAMAEADREIWKYGDPEGHALRHALAAHHGVLPQNIVLGPGIDGLLGYTTRMMVDHGMSVVTSNGAYPTFNFHVAAQGGVLTRVPYRDDREDLDALSETAKKTGAVLVYLANPDNPMGTWWRAEEVTAFARSLPADTLLLLDEAYCDYAPAQAVSPIGSLPANVLRYRTFSKAYGMAGARVGYCIGDADLIGEFEKVRDHYGMNRTAEIGAMAAVADQAWLRQTVEKTASARQRIAAIGRANGLVPIESATNFVTMDCGRGPDFAKSVLEQMLARGVFIRMPGVEPLSRCIRVSAGLPGDLDVLEEMLPQALKAAG